MRGTCRLDCDLCPQAATGCRNRFRCSLLRPEAGWNTEGFRLGVRRRTGSFEGTWHRLMSVPSVVRPFALEDWENIAMFSFQELRALAPRPCSLYRAQDRIPPHS
ncbi:hypothetical protein AGR9A_Cc120252 [Agrobacterium salinitolerans str. Hayward 0363]|nr:hypothetical protein AGR9A_Cc120252 [Agrobacterium salinitolerans str. Hayward 0363]